MEKASDSNYNKKSSKSVERLKKLDALRQVREEAVASTITSCNEDRRAPLVSRSKSKDVDMEPIAASSGSKSNSVMNLSYTLKENQDWIESLHKKEENMHETQYSDYASLARRKYETLLTKLERKGLKDKEESVKKRLEQLINEEQKRRRGFSRRKTFSTTERVSYINERNAKFNRKLERTFGDYIKDDLE